MRSTVAYNLDRFPAPATGKLSTYNPPVVLDGVVGASMVVAVGVVAVNPGYTEGEVEEEEEGEGGRESTQLLTCGSFRSWRSFSRSCGGWAI